MGENRDEGRSKFFKTIRLVREGTNLAGGNVRATWACVTAREAKRQMKVRLSIPILDLVVVLSIIVPFLNCSQPSFLSHDIWL